MTVSAQTDNNILKKLEDGIPPSSSFLAKLMDLRLKKKILGDNIVAYGSVGNQSFYVQAPTLERLDEKLAEVLRDLYKKKSCNNLSN